MNRVDNIQQTFLILDDEIVLTHENEFRVRNNKLSPVGSANSEGAAPGQLLADQGRIHTLCIAPRVNSVKRTMSGNQKNHQRPIGGTYNWGLPATAPAPTPTPEVSPLLDTDGDGLPDAQELLAPSAPAQGTRGTDPRDPRSVLRLSPRDKSATGLTLQLSPLRHRRLTKPRLPTQPGKTYRIEYTEDLTRPWQILQDQIPGDVGTLSAVEGAPPSSSSTPPPPPAPNASTASASSRDQTCVMKSVRFDFRFASVELDISLPINERLKGQHC